jgi:glucose-6-phosphate 1-epimerase
MADEAVNLSELKQRFDVLGMVRFEAGEGGMTRAVATTPLAGAEVYLHGAHVTRYRPAGEPDVLWLSPRSVYRADKAIRGGVPICFPWFAARAGDPAAPMHGFARTSEWRVDAVGQPGDGSVEIILRLEADEQTRRVWPWSFAARYHVRVGRVLELVLRVMNGGTEAFTFEEALHSYLAVGDVRRVRIQGLEGTTYIDKTDANKHKAQGNEAVTFTRETDRIYTNTRATCVLEDPVLGRRINVAKEGSDSTVIWNPWTERAKALADVGQDAWPGFVCVETCNVGDQRVTVQPGETHEMRAAIGVPAAVGR